MWQKCQCSSHGASASSFYFSCRCWAVFVSAASHTFYLGLLQFQSSHYRKTNIYMAFLSPPMQRGKYDTIWQNMQPAVIFLYLLQLYMFDYTLKCCVFICRIILKTRPLDLWVIVMWNTFTFLNAKWSSDQTFPFLFLYTFCDVTSCSKLSE